MIRRTNKIASALVAATIISMAGPIQVKADTYPRIPSEGGIIYEAAAYKDGKFYIDGNTEEIADEGVYYLNGNKYTEINDIDFGIEYTGTYSNKYIEMNDGDYYLDMSNGEISESSFTDDAIDYAAIALKKKIKTKAKDRYSDHSELKTDLVEIPRTKFGESWYAANYDGYTVYTDSNGNYIDADYNLGKIKVQTASGNHITLTYTENKQEGTIAYVSHSNVLGQDADYIYRTIRVNIESDEVISEIDGIAVNGGDTFDTSENDGKTVSFSAIQKISKKQAEDKIDGANYAKTAVTYILSGTDGTSVGLLDDAKISIAGGYIVEYIKNSGTITIQTISLYEERNNQNYVYANNIDPEEIKNMDIDTKGDFWKVEDGFVYKFDNYSEWNKVYRVDKGMDRLSVYDDNHMIIWSDDKDIYSIKADEPEEVVSEETKSEEEILEVAKSDETLASKFGWITNADGSKSYNKAEGGQTLGWLHDMNQWYYFNFSGIMQTGWIKENNNWYNLDESGAMKTGWLNDNGKWYYLNTSGEMLHDTIIHGYKVGFNGEWIE